MIERNVATRSDKKCAHIISYANIMQRRCSTEKHRRHRLGPDNGSQLQDNNIQRRLKNMNAGRFTTARRGTFFGAAAFVWSSTQITDNGSGAELRVAATVGSQNVAGRSAEWNNACRTSLSCGAENVCLGCFFVWIVRFCGQKKG